MNILRSAIDVHGTVDPGYLGMVAGLCLTVGVIPLMCLGMFIQQYYDAAHKFDAWTLGQSMGLAVSAFGALALTVGAFRRMDNKPDPPPPAAQP